MTRTRRHSALALIAAGAACLASAAFPAMHATAATGESDAAPGSGLGSFNLSASAPAYQVMQTDAAYCYGSSAGVNGCELVVPEAVSTLRNGPIGLGLAAIAWPGGLAGNFGSLLITASNGEIPQDARMLNDPVKAEARTSTGPDTVTYDSVPGTVMKATAKDDRTSAEAFVSPLTDAPVGSFGKSSGDSSTAVTGPSTAVATAHSFVKDVDLAGVIKIGSVDSTARATTDGTRATVTGGTQVTNMTVGGIPVTVDERGVHVSGNALPVGGGADQVNAVLKNAGLTILLSKPVGKPDGADVTYNAGSLVISWKPDAANSTTVVLGGVNVSLTATEALSYELPVTEAPPAPAPVSPVDPGTTAPAPELPPIVSAPAPELPGEVPPEVAPVPQAAAPVLAATRSPLPEGLSPWLVLTGLLGTGLVAAGLKRLPDRLLTATGPVCLFEENA